MERERPMVSPTPYSPSAFFIYIFCLLILFGDASPFRAMAGKVEPGLVKRIALGNAGQQYSVWVFFNDKGPIDSASYEREISLRGLRIPERTRFRRAKCLPAERVVDFYDIPVYERYVESVKRFGVRVRVCSRWLNGISVFATGDQIREIAELPFVRSVESVKSFRRGKSPSAEPVAPISLKSLVSHPIDYGSSLGQLEQIGVPELHRQGYHGEGVRICVLDSGFDNLGHEAFRELQIVDQWDFVDGNADVSGDGHGTHVLSVLGGFAEGKLVGPAFRAQFLLARTEDVRTETPIEEDYWIAGLEWGELNGASIVNSSLSYFEWDPGAGVNYTWKDLDGRHGRTSLAADIAASKGVLVVNAIGNAGPDGYLGTPADGRNVLSVGAVDQYGVLAGFSSRGPTYDGRIKPDVVAQGVAVVFASAHDPDEYYVNNGTSFSTPLVTGVCALLLQMHPDWTPSAVARALRQTAIDLGPPGPDNLYGWGLVNAPRAAEFQPEAGPPTIARKIYNYPNPVGEEGTKIAISDLTKTDLRVDIFTVSGQLVRSLWGFMEQGNGEFVFWDGKNREGRKVDSGIYIYRISTKGFEVRGKMAVVR